jgi:hypothetical protein
MLPSPMPTESPQARTSFRRWQRILLVAAGSIVVLIGIGLAVLVRYWPFNQKQIAEILEEVVPGTKVTIAGFHSTYFVHPGCWVEGVVFVRRSSSQGRAPLVTVQKLTIQASYPDLLLRPGHISRILITGLHIQVPPRGPGVSAENASAPASADARRTVVGELVSNGALLDIGRRDNPPLRFEIQTLKLKSVGLSQVMSYSVDLDNPLPPGEVQVTGKLGPWNSQDIGQIPVTGNYKFENADLGVFPGIQGILSSIGRFNGKLGQIEVAGDTDMPEFALKAKKRAIPVKSRFELTVDGTNGDVRLTKMSVLLKDTAVRVQGSILGKSPSPGKTTSLDLLATGGRVQDILQPFVKTPTPPMSGPITFRAHVTFPSEPHPFVKTVRLVGDFAITGGRFNSTDTQEGIDSLSERSRGITNTTGRLETVDPTLTGRVALSGGVAKFSDLLLEIPGAHARMEGNFNIVNEKVDFHGTLKTEAELSQTTKGIKSILLKPLNPLFKRKHGGASIPVEMTGTYSQPHFGVEVVPKHN